MTHQYAFKLYYTCKDKACLEYLNSFSITNFFKTILDIYSCFYQINNKLFDFFILAQLADIF